MTDAEQIVLKAMERENVKELSARVGGACAGVLQVIVVVLKRGGGLSRRDWIRACKNVWDRAV